MDKNTVSQRALTTSERSANKILSFGSEVGRLLPIGTDDFLEVRRENCYYVDKTLMIKDFIETSGKVTLITRPRRFGKTLNMTMIREFFDITKDSRDVFEGLAIMQTRYASFINSRPVIYFSFKNCTAREWSELLGDLKRELHSEYKRYSDILKGYLEQNPSETSMFDMSFNAILDSGSRAADIKYAIKDLTDVVASYYGINPVLVIDEYDQPIMAGYEYGYHDEVGDFFADFYGNVMKGNGSLERALLTGVQKIAQESIFSKFNKVKTYTVLSERYSQYFGLTEDETRDLLQCYGLELNDEVSRQYNGYMFFEKRIYNPWSIVNYADSKILANYWNKTGSNSIIKKLLNDAEPGFWGEFDELVSSMKVTVDMTLETVYNELRSSVNLWGLLLNAGYVTAIDGVEDGAITIRIPNNEVANEFKIVIASISGIKPRNLESMFKYLLGGEINKFIDIYKDIVISYTSYMDVTENTYHMLLLGMSLYLMGSYDIKSNEEAGHGRSDIRMVSLHASYPHVIFEFKRGAEKDLAKLSKEAFQQIHDNKYYAGLTGNVLCIGIAHSKKRCEVFYEAHNIPQKLV